MSETTEETTTFPFANFLGDWTDKSEERLEAFAEQWEEWEQQSAQRAEEAVEQTSSLMESTVDYSLQLQSEMRRQFVENTKKTLEMLS